MENFLKFIFIGFPVVLAIMWVYWVPFFRNFETNFAKNWWDGKVRMVETKWFAITITVVLVLFIVLAFMWFYWGVGLTAVSLGLLALSLVSSGFYFHCNEIIRRSLYVEYESANRSRLHFLAATVGALALFLASIIAPAV